MNMIKIDDFMIYCQSKLPVTKLKKSGPNPVHPSFLTGRGEDWFEHVEDDDDIESPNGE